MTTPIDEERRHHLDLIQSSVARMASNAFQVKGWNIALGGAILALDQKGDITVLQGGMVMSLILWLLDAYYLRLERAFRDLYDAVRAFDDSVGPHSLSPELWYRAQNFCSAIFSPAVAPLHGAILAGFLLLIAKTSGIG